MVGRRSKDASTCQVRQLPFIGCADLALHLVRFDGSAPVNDELRTLTVFAGSFDRNRPDLTKQDVQKLSDCPSAFVAIAEFIGFATSARAHSPLLRARR
jgi:hypothetical protein